MNILSPIVIAEIKDDQYYITVDGRILKGRKEVPTYLRNGYKTVTLWINKRNVNQYVHALVLETFIGKCPVGYQCRHLDGNKLNNNLYNLRWGTRKENQVDRLTHGTDNRGEKHGRHKLTELEVRAIRLMITSGVSHIDIAKAFNLAKSTISSIATKRSWNWLT